MSDAPRLYDLQLIDLEIDEKEARLAQIQNSLGETDELLQARNESQEADVALSELNARSLDLELQIGTFESQIQEIEGRLYSGSIRSPRELAALEHDLKSHRNQKGKLEDQQIELMVKLDEARTNLSQKREGLAQAESEWQEGQKAIQDEIDLVAARLEELHGQRLSLASGFDAATMGIYEELRRTRRGRAVAKVEQSTCTGCRITLPSHEVQRARLSPRLCHCSNCGRILWATR